MRKIAFIIIFISASPAYAMDLTHCFNTPLEPTQEVSEQKIFKVASLRKLCIKKIPSVIEKYLKQESSDGINWQDEQTKEKVKTFIKDIPSDLIAKIIKYNKQPINIAQKPLLRTVLANLCTVNNDHTRFLIKEEQSISVKNRSNGVIASIPTINTVFHVALSPDGEHVAIRYPDCITMYDSVSTKEIATLETKKIHEDVERFTLFLNNSALLIPTYASIKKWEFKKGTEIRDLIVHNGIEKLLCLAGRKIIFTNFCSKNQPVIKIVTHSGAIEKKLKGHTGNINYLSFNVHTHCLASASEDRSVRIWDIKKIADDACIVEFKHPYVVDSVGFSPYGSKVITGMTRDDHAVYIWEKPKGSRSRKIISTAKIKYIFKDNCRITFVSWAKSCIITKDACGRVYTWSSDLNAILESIRDVNQ